MTYDLEADEIPSLQANQILACDLGTTLDRLDVGARDEIPDEVGCNIAKLVGGQAYLSAEVIVEIYLDDPIHLKIG